MNQRENGFMSMITRGLAGYSFDDLMILITETFETVLKHYNECDVLNAVNQKVSGFSKASYYQIWEYM